MVIVTITIPELIPCFHGADIVVDGTVIRSFETSGEHTFTIDRSFDVVLQKVTGQLNLDMIHNNKYGIRDLLNDIIGFTPAQADAVNHRNMIMGEVHKAITNPEAMARMDDQHTM